MKAYCNKQKIKQTDLNHLFKIYLSSDEVYLREFRVATTGMYTYSYIHTHTYILIHLIHTCSYIHTHTYILIHTYSYIHTHTYIHTYILIHTHAYSYVHIRIHMHTTDTKKYFERPNQQMLQFEISDIFLPALFSKKHDILPTPDEFEECTFTRFVIVGYIFCAQPLTDLIYDFLLLLIHFL